MSRKHCDSGAKLIWVHDYYVRFYKHIFKWDDKKKIFKKYVECMISTCMQDQIYIYMLWVGICYYSVHFDSLKPSTGCFYIQYSKFHSHNMFMSSISVTTHSFYFRKVQKVTGISTGEAVYFLQEENEFCT
jgi:hypothetical protein